MFEYIVVVVLANLTMLAALYFLRHVIAIRAPVLLIAGGISILYCVLYPFLAAQLAYPQVVYVYVFLVVAGACTLYFIENRFFAVSEVIENEHTNMSIGESRAAEGNSAYDEIPAPGWQASGGMLPRYKEKLPEDLGEIGQSDDKEDNINREDSDDLTYTVGDVLGAIAALRQDHIKPGDAGGVIAFPESGYTVGEATGDIHGEAMATQDKAGIITADEVAALLNAEGGKVLGATGEAGYASIGEMAATMETIEGAPEAVEEYAIDEGVPAVQAEEQEEEFIYPDDSLPLEEESVMAGVEEEAITVSTGDAAKKGLPGELEQAGGYLSDGMKPGNLHEQDFAETDEQKTAEMAPMPEMEAETWVVDEAGLSYADTPKVEVEPDVEKEAGAFDDYAFRIAHEEPVMEYVKAEDGTEDAESGVEAAAADGIGAAEPFYMDMADFATAGETSSDDVYSVESPSAEEDSSEAEEASVAGEKTMPEQSYVSLEVDAEVASEEEEFSEPAEEICVPDEHMDGSEDFYEEHISSPAEAGVAAAAHAAEDDINSLVAGAFDMLVAGDSSGAVENFFKALKLDPPPRLAVMLCTRISSVYTAQGRKRQALAVMEMLEVVWGPMLDESDIEGIKTIIIQLRGEV